MSNNYYNLSFHETFPPNLAHISAILRLSTGENAYTKEEISQQTGIPTGKASGKVRPAIYYAKYMGLIDYTLKEKRYTLRRTHLGETVYFEDATLSEKLTQLLCHAMITSTTGATIWNVIFKRILSQSNSIDLSLLDNSIRTILDTQNRDLGIGPFNSCYKNTFNTLNILNYDYDKGILSLNPFDNSTIDNDYIYLYAYTLLYEWEHLYTEQEITADMFDSIYLWVTFGWDKQKEYQVLEKLSDLGVIRFNRQLSPFTILKLTDSDSMIDKLYSLLL